MPAWKDRLAQLIATRDIYILSALWIAVQALLLYRHGIVTVLEAGKYIEQAHYLIDTGRVSSPNFWLYSTQIFLIAAAIKLKTGFLSVALVQMALGAFATVYFFRFCKKNGSINAAFICTGLLILNFPFQTFNVYLQTESIFHSLTIIYCCYLLGIQRLSLKDMLTVVLFLALICVTRPTGLLLIPGTGLYLLFRFFRNYCVTLKISIAILTGIAFLAVLNAALGSGGELDFMLPNRTNSIICGVPGPGGPVSIDVSNQPNSIWGLFYFVTHNFGIFLKLALKRTAAFLGVIRSYYSTGHNIYLSIYFYPLYVYLLLTVRKWTRGAGGALVYFVPVIFLTWVAVMLTCDDWHNRFLLSVTPYLYLLCLYGHRKLPPVG